MKPNRKKPTKKPKPKTPTIKINFLEKRKTETDKFFDILEKHTKKNFKVHTKGKKRGETYFSGRTGKKELAKKLKVKTSQITKWEKFGVDQISKTQKKKLQTLHKGFSKVKKETKEFTKHTFTKKNFFHKKKLPKRKKRQQFYFRAGLFMRFNNGYTINNLPVSHYDFKGYPEGYKAMWELIRITIAQYDSLSFFRVNYFDVSLIDL